MALVGSTSSGKTTVVNLLLRFYDTDCGTILINGQDISRISRKSLRKNVSIVLQDTVLFSDTVRQNLQYAKVDATQEQLDQAMEMSLSKSILDSAPSVTPT